MDGQRGERLAAIVAVPDDDLVGAAAEEALDGSVDLAGQQLTHLGIFRFSLILPADARDTFGIVDHEDGFPRLRPGGRQAEQHKSRKSHSDVWYHQHDLRYSVFMFRHCSRLMLVAVAMRAAPNSQPPTSWIDPDTGHRIVRLTHAPGSASLYFNQNGYTADGKKMVYTTPDGISVFDLKTHAAKSVVQGKVRIIVTGRKTQSTYYTKEGAVYASDVDTGAAREIAWLPPRGSISTVNADETLLAGTFIEGDGRDYNSARPPGAQQLDQPRNKGQMMEQGLAAHLPIALLTVKSKT